MVNHPNRGKRGPYSNPRNYTVQKAREQARHTVEQAAELICVRPSTWELFELGSKPMHPGLWRLYCEKTGWPWP